jgi:lipopolysaccharide/colanic/teichoic acid biosynthesis glycosyltransferase
MILSSLPQDLTAPVFDVYVYPASSQNGPEKTPGNPLGVDHEASTIPDVPPPVAEPAKNSAEPASGGTGEVLPPVFAHQLPLWKDVLDVFLAVVALILLSPLFLIVAAYIKIVSPGPVFFKQERVGFRGKKFTIWKFRTMKVDNDAKAHEEYLKSLIQGGDQAMVKLDAKKDPRIIPLGGVLRQTGLDELPQLINVFLGDMSLVGPRPCLPYEAREYDRWHAERFDTAPGLTGLWQVSGKNRTTFKDMIRFDIRYAKRMSLWMEIQILFRTFPAIFQQIRDHREKVRASEDRNTIRSGKENA